MKKAFPLICIPMAALVCCLAACGRSRPPATAHKLKLKTAPEARVSVTGPITGYQDAGGPGLIEGWVWDKTLNSAHPKVNIYADGKLIGTIAADQYRKDLQDSGIGDGRHGFKFPVPAEWKDGKAHVFTLKVAGIDALLFNTPMTLTFAP